MTAIKPGEGTTQWATIAEAEKLPSSKGVKQLRADVLTLSKMGDKIKNIDLTNHFLIRIAENKVHTTPMTYTKHGFFRNKVAMKVEKDKAGIDRYVILNINSLSKRLGISKAAIREAEKKGKVNELVQTRLQEIATQQETITKIIKEIYTGVKESKPCELKDEEKKLLKEFVNTHFENPVLRKGISTFSEKKFGGDDPQATAFLHRLISKIWWNAPELLGAEDHEKLSLTKETLSQLPWGERVFMGAALKLPGNAGNDMRRAQVLPWDTKHRYAIAIGDYVYSEKPIPRSNKEVPMRMMQEEQWVLASVNSLKRLGFSTGEIRKLSKNETLSDEIAARLEVIDQFNKAIKPGIGIDGLKVVMNYAKTHPNKDVRKILKTALKEHAKIGKGLEKRFKRQGPDTGFHSKQYMEIHIPRWEKALFKHLKEAGAIQGET